MSHGAIDGLKKIFEVKGDATTRALRVDHSYILSYFAASNSQNWKFGGCCHEPTISTFCLNKSPCTGYIYFLERFLNIAKMPKKPFSLRSVHCTHIKYAKKMKKFDREVLSLHKSRKSVFSVRNSLSSIPVFFGVIEHVLCNLKSGKNLQGLYVERFYQVSWMSGFISESYR